MGTDEPKTPTLEIVDDIPKHVEFLRSNGKPIKEPLETATARPKRATLNAIAGTPKRAEDLEDAVGLKRSLSRTGVRLPKRTLSDIKEDMFVCARLCKSDTTSKQLLSDATSRLPDNASPQTGSNDLMHIELWDKGEVPVDVQSYTKRSMPKQLPPKERKANSRWQGL